MKTVHRIVTPIVALLSLPALYFLPLFRIFIASGLSTEKTNLLDNFGLSEFISVNNIVSAFSSGAADSMNTYKTIWDAFAGDKKQEMLDMLPGLHWGIIFLVFLALVIITALSLAIVSAATKKPAASIILSIAGLGFALIMNASFDAFAKPFLNGAFNLNSLLGNTNQLLSLLLGNVASFEYMKLGIAYSAILLIFVTSLILSISAHVEQKNGG